MIYNNKKYKFSIQLADEWKIKKDFGVFSNKVDFSRASGGSIGISISRLKEESQYNKERLERELLDSLNNTISTQQHKNTAPYLVNRNLDNEINTAWGEFVYMELGAELEMFGEVFAIRNGLKYVIIYLCSANDGEEVKTVLDSFKFKEQAGMDQPKYSLVMDEGSCVHGFWLHDARSFLKDAHAEGALKHVRLRMLVVKHNLPSSIYEDLMSDNYRVVPNSFDNKGGDFLMFGSAKAPGEK